MTVGLPAPERRRRPSKGPKPTPTGVIDDTAIAIRRLHAQHLAGPAAPTAVDVVAGLLGVQAENHSQASWAVAARTHGLTETAFARLFDEGAILRTHVLRPTWHYVSPDDIAWLVSLTAPRVLRTFRQLRRELGIADATIDAATTVILDALGAEGHLTRAELGERLANHGLPADGRSLMVVVAHAELAALICSGPTKDGRHTYALLEERAPNARRLDREEALAELAQRYFTGHGPATERDLAYWATMTLTDVRAGLSAIAAQLESFEHDGRTYWQGPRSDAADPPSPRAHLLQMLDEYYRGYQDSRWALDTRSLLSRGRETSAGMAILDGQIVGDMRRTLRPPTVAFELGLLRDLDQEERDALWDAAHRYGRYLGLQPWLSFEPSSARRL